MNTLSISCFAAALLFSSAPVNASTQPVITVVKSEIRKDGYVQLHLSATKPANANVSDGFYEGSRCIGGGGLGTGGVGPILTTVAFYLHTAGDGGMKTWTKRLRVNKGDAFSLTKGQRFYFYDFAGADRTRNYGYIEWNS